MKNESEDWCTRAWNRLPTDLKLLRFCFCGILASPSDVSQRLFDCIIQEQTEEFSVSRCLHREHYVNSGMRHRSDCRGRTTSLLSALIQSNPCNSSQNSTQFNPIQSMDESNQYLSAQCHFVYFVTYVWSLVGLPDGEKNFEGMYNRLHAIPACDGQPD